MSHITPPDPVGRGELSLSDSAPAEQPRLLAMVGLVALIVALVILVFFGIGYVFGRLFL